MSHGTDSGNLSDMTKVTEPELEPCVRHLVQGDFDAIHSLLLRLMVVKPEMAVEVAVEVM